MRAADNEIFYDRLTGRADFADQWPNWGPWLGKDSLNRAVSYAVQSAIKVMGVDAGNLPHLVRCVAGNPFRPVALDPSWLTSTVVALARGIYDDRSFDRLPILADALQDAGCDSDSVLSHCRGDGPHVRGCWVVDAILGKR